jgi:hypothetical protein
MHEHLKIAIEEVDAVIHELLGQEGKGAAAAGDAAIKLMDARERIFDRVAATMPAAFEKPATPNAA